MRASEATVDHVANHWEAKTENETGQEVGKMQVYKVQADSTNDDLYIMSAEDL